MISRWKRYGLQALLAAALSAAPAVAGPDTDTPKLTDSQRLEAIQTQLGELKDNLKSLDTLKLDMAKLRADTTILLGLQDRASAFSNLAISGLYTAVLLVATALFWRRAVRHWNAYGA